MLGQQPWVYTISLNPGIINLLIMVILKFMAWISSSSLIFLNCYRYQKLISSKNMKTNRKVYELKIPLGLLVHFNIHIPFDKNMYFKRYILQQFTYT